MSRRCDREGVRWPRLLAYHRDHIDELDVRTFVARVFGVRIRPYQHDVLRHLRERPVLP